MAKYGQNQAPEYNLSRTTFPVNVYYGSNDYLVNAEVSGALMKKRRKNPPWTRVDFLFLLMTEQRHIFSVLNTSLQNRAGLVTDRRLRGILPCHYNFIQLQFNIKR